jgi:hypothetical protein
MGHSLTSHRRIVQLEVNFLDGGAATAVGEVEIKLQRSLGERDSQLSFRGRFTAQ